MDGFISSLISSSIVYPLDLLKTQYQVSYSKNLSLNYLIKDVYKQQGIFGFYKGLTPFLSTYPLFWGIYFPIYEKRLFNNHNIVNSYTSAIVATTITNPLFVINTRLQTNNLKTQKLSFMQIVRQKGYMKGWTSTQLNCTKLGIQIPFYDYLKSKDYNTFSAALISKCASSALFYPFDAIRSNQRDSLQTLKLIDCCKNIYRKNGLLGFYRGVGIYSIVTSSNFILMMLIKENFFKIYK